MAEQSVLEAKQKIVGKISDDERLRAIQHIQNGYPKIVGALIFTVLTLAAIVIITVSVKSFMAWVLGALMALFVVLLMGPPVSLKMKRLRMARDSDLDVYEVTGVLTYQTIRIPARSVWGTMYFVKSYVLYIDAIQLPAIVEGDSCKPFLNYISGASKTIRRFTVRYVPSISVNLEIRDSAGNRQTF